MTIATTFAELDGSRESAKTLALVPTMGALHEGHLNLIRTAKTLADRVAVSIFVNPTQFGKGEDFERYPRDLHRDAAAAQAAGADLVFAPTVAEMYPGLPTLVQVPEVTERWEGASRPGHFNGVATVVTKLFGLVQPQVAIFGWKDLQQCLVIRRMTADLNLPVRLHFCETTREPDGLAMSSRNAYLSVDERKVAPSLYQELKRLGNAVENSETTSPNFPAQIASEIDGSTATLHSLGFQVDYLAWVDLHSMTPFPEQKEPSAIIVAAKLGNTRLIDNLRLFC